MPAGHRTANGGASAGAEQAAADRTLAGIVWVRAARQSQHQPSANDTRGNPALHVRSFLNFRAGKN
jgi:hypothetical protein